MDSEAGWDDSTVGVGGQPGALERPGLGWTDRSARLDQPDDFTVVVLGTIGSSTY